LRAKLFVKKRFLLKIESESIKKMNFRELPWIIGKFQKNSCRNEKEISVRIDVEKKR
jgi:hypothetical protein